MNGNQLEAVLSIPGWSFVIGLEAYREVSVIPAQKEILDRFIFDGMITMYKADLTLDLLTRLFSTYNLGDGETEAIAMCFEKSYHICCDDKKARNAAIIELSEPAVMGSLRLLKMAVATDVIACHDARFCYLEMRLQGGFLPSGVEDSYFCSDS